MGAGWCNGADLHVVSRGCHAFTLIPTGSATEEGLQNVDSFVGKHLAQLAAIDVHSNLKHILGICRRGRLGVLADVWLGADFESRICRTYIPPHRD